MNKFEIENTIYNDIIKHRQEAEHQADIRYFKLLQNPKFEELDKQIRAKIIEKAKVEFEGKSAKDIDESILSLKKQRQELLNSLNMTIDDLKPKYHCNKCNDTAFIGNSRCTCYQNAVIKALFDNSNLSNTMTNTFKDFDCKVYDDENFANKLLKLGQDIVNDNGQFRVPLIILQGKVGSGKTFFVECLCNELVNKGVSVVYMTAFELSQKLLDWHLADFDTKQILQQVFFDSDVLVVDDLGTEPIYKNISIEYMQNIIDIRVRKNKLTILSTNLLTNDFSEMYGDRLLSRVFMSNCALKLNIQNSDLRMKKYGAKK